MCSTWMCLLVAQPLILTVRLGRVRRQDRVVLDLDGLRDTTCQLRGGEVAPAFLCFVLFRAWKSSGKGRSTRRTQRRRSNVCGRRSLPGPIFGPRLAHDSVCVHCPGPDAGEAEVGPPRAAATVRPRESRSDLLFSAGARKRVCALARSALRGRGGRTARGRSYGPTSTHPVQPPFSRPAIDSVCVCVCVCVSTAPGRSDRPRNAATVRPRRRPVQPAGLGRRSKGFVCVPCPGPTSGEAEVGPPRTAPTVRPRRSPCPTSWPGPALESVCVCVFPLPRSARRGGGGRTGQDRRHGPTSTQSGPTSVSRPAPGDVRDGPRTPPPPPCATLEGGGGGPWAEVGPPRAAATVRPRDGRSNLLFSAGGRECVCSLPRFDLQGRGGRTARGRSNGPTSTQPVQPPLLGRRSKVCVCVFPDPVQPPGMRRSDHR